MLLLFLACRPPTESGESSPLSESKESPADSEMDSQEVGSYPWSRKADWWTEPGPMAGRMFPETVPGGLWAVRMATSRDGQSWEADPRYIAYGFSSLDLLRTEAGLILSGVVQFIEGDTVLLEQPSLLALVTPDLQQWGSQRFSITGATRRWTVDGGLRLNPDGLFQAHWFGTDIEGDPATQPGLHEVYSGAWNGESMQQERLVYSRELLADPSICWHGSQEWLFYTHEGTVIRAAKGNGDGTFADTDHRYEFVNVPFCEGTDPELGFYAQNTGGGGPPWHVRLQEDGTFIDRQNVYTEDLFGEGNCTSPVATYFQGQYVLFCAVLVIH